MIYSFKLYTECSTEEQAKNILDILFNENITVCTITKATGYWEGQREGSVVIELIGTVGNRDKLASIAKRIKQANNQESVLLTGIQLSDYEMI